MVISVRYGQHMETLCEVREAECGQCTVCNLSFCGKLASTDRVARQTRMPQYHQTRKHLQPQVRNTLGLFTQHFVLPGSTLGRQLFFCGWSSSNLKGPPRLNTEEPETSTKRTKHERTTRVKVHGRWSLMQRFQVLFKVLNVC